MITAEIAALLAEAALVADTHGYDGAIDNVIRRLAQALRESVEDGERRGPELVVWKSASYGWYASWWQKESNGFDPQSISNCEWLASASKMPIDDTMRIVKAAIDAARREETKG